MFEMLFIIVPIFIVCVFIFTFAMILSPKLRGKMLSRQVKSLKYMMDESKDDLEDLAKTSINTSNKILGDNEEVLKDISTKYAEINKDAIETTAKAIKKGLSDDKLYCKNCGVLIDSDANFCSKCGKEQ